MKVKSLKTHCYSGACHPKGDVYEIFSEKDLKVLRAVGIVEIYEATLSEPKILSKPVKKPAKESVRTVESEAKPKRKYTRRGGQYSRRDMRAESEEE